MASFRALRPTRRPAPAGRRGVLGTRSPLLFSAALLVAAATLLLTVQLASQPEQPGKGSARSFLTSALGAPQASTPLVRKPRPGVRLRVDRGARFTREGATVGVALADADAGAWSRYVRGASRTTSFGSETVVFRGEYGLEQFLRVDRRQGLRTWRWRLSAPGLTPSLEADGGIDFTQGSRTAGIRITPVEIFDLKRKRVTPSDARWSLSRANDDEWTLALRLDDSRLPLPYVIDPNIARTGVNSAGSANGVTSLAITRPGNVGDILIAQIAVRNNATINAPAGWTPVGSQQNSGTGLTQRVFWATGAAGLSTTFSWTGSAHASGGISAYSDVHPTSPIDGSNSGSGSTSPASAPSVTTNYADAMLVALYSVQGNTTATQSGGQGVTQHYTAISTGNPAGNRARVTGSDGLQAAAGGSGAKTATLSAASPWAAHLVALRPEPPDGAGAMSVDRTQVAASSAGNTLVFTYTPSPEGLVNGEVRLTVPSGWTAPSLVGSNAGYTTASTGTLSLSGSTIIVSGLTTTSSFTITYGSTASGGPGATAPATSGVQTWTTQQKGTSGGTLTDLASQPTVNVNAPNGSGTISASRSNVAASSTGNTITFTYTAATGGMTNGSVSIDVPSSWSAPSTAGSSAGYTTATQGTVGVSGQTITVSGLTLTAGTSFDIVYGSTAGGGAGATASSTVGAVSWQAKQRSTNFGALTNLASSPSITQNAPNGSGSLSPAPSTVGYGTAGNTITFTYTAAGGGTANGSVSLDVPTGWSAPSTTGSAAGFSTSTAGTLSVSGQTITVSGVTLAAGGTFDIVYGSKASGGPGASAPASAGAATWQGRQRSTDVGSLVNLTGGSPSITVAPQPSPPSGLATSPASPANDTSPEVSGSADAGTTVRIYKTADCSGAVAGSATAATFASPGITVSVTDNATTSLSGTATDAYGVVSACSTSISYTADSNVPAPPSSLVSAPASPANANSPAISGSAEAGSTVRLYTTADCSGAPVASGSAASFGSLGLTVTVSDNTTTTFKATATDNANNTSSCSSGVAYVEDSTAPNAPSTLDSSPASPANANSPAISGSAEAGSTVRLYTTSDCSGAPVASGSAASFASPGFTVTVSDNTSTTFKATATDSANNTSSCSSGLTYVEDSAAPAAPSGLGTTPASPANDNDPRLSGTAEAGSTVTLYATADCTGASVGSGSAATFGGAGIDVPNVADDSTTTYTAKATDAAGNPSSCSADWSYVEDSTTPAAPSSLGTSPASPANDNDPKLTGSAEAGSTVTLYASADCTGASAGSGSAAAFGGAGIDVANVADDSTTTYTAKTTDAAGNTSACSAPTTYVEDSTTPSAPSSLGTTPASPANNNDPKLTGGSEAGSTVTIYASADCSGAATGSGSAAAFAGAGIDVANVADNSTTTYTAKATDAAGNASPCSSPITYVEDSAAPSAPTISSSAPASPANDNDPELLGAAEAGSTVRIYTNASCTSAIAASGSAASFSSPGLTVSVGDNTTTNFYATATDAVGNVSGCSSPAFAYVEQSGVLAPTGLATTPASPANDNNPKVTGNAEPGMTIRLYTSADCSGAPVASGTTAQFASPGLSAAVADDTTTQFRATADDGAGNVSSCSDPVTYVEDSTAPAPPSGLASSPGSPANENDPEISGSAAAGSTVRLYTTSDCSGAPVASGAAANFATPGFTVSVANDSSTSLRATATDSANNTSACSADYTYVEDSTAPAAPTGLGSTPSSPANDNDPAITGAAEASSIVRVYTTGDCSGAPAASGTAAAFAGSGLGVTVADNSTTTFKTTATDGAGNTSGCSTGYVYAEDSTVPASTVSFPLSGGAYRAATWADFGGAASDTGSGLARVELSIERLADGQFWNGSAFSGSSENWRTAAGTASWSYGFAVADYTADGQYRVRVRAVDDAGNAEAPSSRTYAIDRVAPTTTIDSGPADPSNDANPAFAFSSSEGGSTFECSLDGGGTAACTSPKSYSSLAEGSHTFEVTATDAAGNVDATSATRTWTLDRTDPSAAYSFPAAGGSYNGASWNNFSGTAADTGGAGLQRVELSIRSVASGNYWDGSAFGSATQAWHTASGTSSWTLSFPPANFPADGDYEVRVRAVDNATNASGALLRSFVVDTVAPETTIDSGPAGDTPSANATFNFSADQGGSTFECRLDGGAWAGCTSPKSYTGLGEGGHSFDVRATDPGSNTDPTPASRNWVVDTLLPTAALDSPANWIRLTVTLTATATDSGSGVASVRFDRSPAGAGSWTPIGSDTTAPYSYDFDTTAVGNGLYDFRVIATDRAGNPQASNVVTNIHVDNAPPNAVMNDPGAAVSGTVTLTHSSTDAESGIDAVQFQYRALPAGAWADTSASWNTTALSDGEYELRVRVTDRAGNSAMSAVKTTLVDNTVPTVSYTVPTEGGFINAASNDPLTLVASANDLGSGVANVEFFACTAGGSSCTSSTSLGVDTAGPYEANWPLPADGAHWLKAVATDNASRQASVVIGVTVDRTVPDTTLLSNPGTPTNQPAPTFTFSSNETGATFECRIDGGVWSLCATPHTTAPLADGNHTFDVRAVDAAGNRDAAPATWAFLLDATPPTAAIDDPGANLRLVVGLTSTQSDPGAFASGIASVQYEYSVADAETWVVTAPTWDTATVVDGVYDVRVVVTDNAGNVTASAPVQDRRIDNTAPATSHDDPGANVRQTVTLAGQASDAGSGVQQVDFQISPTGANSWSVIGAATGAPYQVTFDTTTYADGLYDFRTVARDVAGNQTEGTPVVSRRIDNTPPTATMNDPGAYLRGTVNLTSVSDDAGGSGVSSVVYEYSPAGGASWQPISATWATDGVADGVYDLHVVVRDVAGNETISAPVTGRRVDNTAPSTGHNAPGGWQSGAVTVSLSPDDGGGSGVSNTQYAVNGGGWQSGTSVTLSSDGIHTISFFSTDAAGNVESPKTATVMIDSTPPPPGANDPGNYLSGDVTLTANADTGGEGAPIDNVSFQYSPASAGTWTTIGVDSESPYSVVWSTTSVTDGAYDLRFEVTDTATPPNVSTQDLASKIVDNTPPTASMGSPLNGAVVSGDVTMGVSANDANPIKRVEYFVRGSSVGASTSPPFQATWNSASAGDGPAEIYAQVEDMAGHTTTTNTISVTADNFAPSVSLANPGPALRGSVTLSASADGDTVQVTFERRPAGGGGWTTIGTANGGPWSTSFVTTTVPDGDYELRAIATDAGGNSGTSSVVTTKVDNTNPNGSLTRPGNGQLVGGPAVALEASAGDGASGVAQVTFQYSQSGIGAWTDAASDSSAPFQATWDTTPLTSVAHDLRIIVTDAAGNQFTSGPTTVVVDSTPPGVTLDHPGSELSGTVALSASTTGDAAVVTFAYSPAGASSWTTIASDGSPPYGANFNTTTVADGTYDLRAVVSDSVGNTSSSVRSGIRIDNFMPVLTSSTPANGSIVASADSVVLAFSEAGSVSNLLLDGNPAPCTAPCSGSSVTLNTGPLADGSHTVTGTVRDAAGNSSSFSISFVVGVPTPPSPSTGEASEGTPFAVSFVPTPTNFRGRILADGTLTLQWTPVRVGETELATILLVDGVATLSFAPGEDEANLGAFDPADMRTFSVAAVGTDGTVGLDTWKLRSTSLLAGKPLAEAEASLVNRGLKLGTVRGKGSVVVEPKTALLVPLEGAVDVTLGEPAAPQTKLAFQVVGAKTFSRKVRKYVALRVKVTRPAQVTATLLSPSGVRVYRWRFRVNAGARIVRLAMPPQVRQAGRYRLVFTVRSGRDVVKRTLTLQVLGPNTRELTPRRGPIDVILAGGSNVRKQIAADLASNGLRVTAAVGGDDAFGLAASSTRNVRVIVVDADRYGIGLVRDLALVFPGMRILALTNDPRRLAQAVRAGASIAVPRSTPPKELARLIARLARR